MALKQRPALAARGPLARWCGAVAGTAPAGARRLLVLSSFIASPRRVTRDAARRRNEMVAALADQVCIAHLAAGSRTTRMAAMLTRWGVLVSTMTGGALSTTPRRWKRMQRAPHNRWQRHAVVGCFP